MYNINKTETPIFLVCSLFPKAIFFTLFVQKRVYGLFYDAIYIKSCLMFCPFVFQPL